MTGEGVSCVGNALCGLFTDLFTPTDALRSRAESVVSRSLRRSVSRVTSHLGSDGKQIVDSSSGRRL